MSHHSSSAMEVGRRRKKEFKRRSISSNLDRGDFIRSGAVVLAGGSAAIFGGGRVAWGVGVQPGERTTAPPSALLLVPALRAKVTVLLCMCMCVLSICGMLVSNTLESA